MHEAGILHEIIKVAERAAKENDANEVKTIVLEVGELSLYLNSIKQNLRSLHFLQNYYIMKKIRTLLILRW